MKTDPEELQLLAEITSIEEDAQAVILLGADNLARFLYKQIAELRIEYRDRFVRSAPWGTRNTCHESGLLALRGSGAMSAIGITTKYLARSDRIKAWMPDMTERKAVTISYNHELDQFGAHKEAAVMFAHRHGLSGTLVACSLDRGYCFTFLGNGLGTHVVTANQNGAGI